MYTYVYMYVYIYMYEINLRNLNYYYSSQRSITLVATLLYQQSAQLNKGKEHYVRSICGQQLFRTLRAHQRSSDQLKILQDQSAQSTTRAVDVENKDNGKQRYYDK